MTFVIASPCIGEKSAKCATVCPVDCIHPKRGEPDFSRAKMLYIDAVACIDCGACEIACPVDAIFADDKLPAKWKSFEALNQKYYAQGIAAATPRKHAR